jgi:hypothetical protein
MDCRVRDCNRVNHCGAPGIRISMRRRSIIRGTARILRAGDSERFRESRTSVEFLSAADAAMNRNHFNQSSSPQNAATSMLEAYAPRSV